MPKRLSALYSDVLQYLESSQTEKFSLKVNFHNTQCIIINGHM